MLPQRNTTITPMLTLVEPYRRRLCAFARDCRSPDDASLPGEVYGLAGFPPAPGVDYETAKGVVAGSKHGVSVYVLNLRLGNVLTAAAAAVNNLCPGSNASSNANVQLAVQSAVVDALAAKANATERRASLSELTTVTSVMQGALANVAAPQADVRTCANLTADQRNALFSVLAEVRRPRGWGRVGAAQGRGVAIIKSESASRQLAARIRVWVAARASMQLRCCAAHCKDSHRALFARLCPSHRR